MSRPASSKFDDPGQKEPLVAACEEVGFPLADVRQEGDVLVLVPETLSALPSSSQLQHLSDRIQQLGYRYVAFAVKTEN